MSHFDVTPHNTHFDVTPADNRFAKTIDQTGPLRWKQIVSYPASRHVIEFAQ